MIHDAFCFGSQQGSIEIFVVALRVGRGRSQCKEQLMRIYCTIKVEEVRLDKCSRVGCKRKGRFRSGSSYPPNKWSSCTGVTLRKTRHQRGSASLTLSQSFAPDPTWWGTSSAENAPCLCDGPQSTNRHVPLGPASRVLFPRSKTMPAQYLAIEAELINARLLRATPNTKWRTIAVQAVFRNNRCG